MTVVTTVGLILRKTRLSLVIFHKRTSFTIQRLLFEFVINLWLFQVNLCEAEGLIEMLGEPLPMCKSTDSGVLVAVKTLRRKADEPAR